MLYHVKGDDQAADHSLHNLSAGFIRLTPTDSTSFHVTLCFHLTPLGFTGRRSRGNHTKLTEM